MYNTDSRYTSTVNKMYVCVLFSIGSIKGEFICRTKNSPKYGNTEEEHKGYVAFK